METISNLSIFGTALENEILDLQAILPKKSKLVIEEGEKREKETFSLSSFAGKIVLKAGSSSSILEGLSLLEVALKGKRLPVFLGPHSPVYPLRLIWLCGREVSLPPEILCRRLIRLGYNGAISTDVPLLNAIKAFGLKGIFNLEGVEGCPLDETWDQNIQEKLDALSSLDGVLFEGSYLSLSYQRHPKARDLLQRDLALLELKKLELHLGSKYLLIYVLPYHPSLSWVPELLDEAGEKTIVAFSAVSGAPCKDHLSSHPLWEQLQYSPDRGGTPLLPIINGGSVGQGEGFWPVVPLDLIEKSIFGMEHQAFSGAIVLTKTLPKPGSFLDAGLWVAGQSLKGRGRPSFFPKSLLESWCAAYCPELNLWDGLEDVRRVVKYLSGLRCGEISSEEGRLMAECVMAELHRLQWKVEKNKKEEGSVSFFYEYFKYFIRDAKRLVAYFLQTRHLPFLYELSQEDRKEAFWTEMVSKGGVSSEKVVFLETPNQGEEGSVLRQIYIQTT